MCKIGFYRFFLFIFLLIDVHYVNSKKQVKYKQSKQIQPTEVREINDESIEKTDVKVPTGPQTLSFTPGNLTDEDFHSLHMPQDLLCDGCITVAYVVSHLSFFLITMFITLVDLLDYDLEIEYRDNRLTFIVNKNLRKLLMQPVLVL